MAKSSPYYNIHVKSCYSRHNAIVAWVGLGERMHAAYSVFHSRLYLPMLKICRDFVVMRFCGYQFYNLALNVGTGLFDEFQLAIFICGTV